NVIAGGNMRVIFFTVLGIGLALGSGCGKKAPPPVVLGHVATLSGPDKQAGEQARRGIHLAVQELNAPAGEGDRPLQVRHPDTQGKLDNFEGEAVRLVSVNKAVALFGGTKVDEVMKMQQSRVPILTPLGQRTEGMGDLVFCMGLSPAFQGKVLARFAAEQVARVAVLVDERREGATLLAEEFAREFKAKADAKKGGGRPTLRRFGKDTSFAELARQIDTDKAPAVLFAGTPQDLLTFRKALKASDVKLFFGGDDGSARVLTEEGGLDGLVLVSAWAPDLDVK